MKNIRPIHSDADLAWAVSEIEPYFNQPPEKGTPEADRFDVLADLIEAYEGRSFFVADMEPIDFLKSFMDMTGRSQGDLAEVLGSRSRASEILNRRRALTVDMIYRLKEGWGLSADSLAKPYALAAG